MKTRAYRTVKAVTVAVAAATLCLALYIMANRLGLSESYDFGAGAYYYADSPQLQDLAEKAVYKTSVPVWVHIVLFLCWGWLMYRLWVRVDRKKDEQL
ncbi:MAG: hypothetical protein IKR88_06160 [Bacteroidales bacterium]|nr:hypothetical protein [Bacteroidales bacterium]